MDKNYIVLCSWRSIEVDEEGGEDDVFCGYFDTKDKALAAINTFINRGFIRDYHANEDKTEFIAGDVKLETAPYYYAYRMVEWEVNKIFQIWHPVLDT